jgi:squalene-hopene/tetraprenyl-beta-curcumene cyclase
LPVVSYALPALIAVGQARHHHRPSHNPAARLARALVRGPVLKVLEEIQPSSGGFLEAVPLTSFVTMSLAASGWADHPVSRKAAEFLARSARPDGSWPIDTNLATWLTTLSVNALGQGGESPRAFPQGERCAVQDWLLAQQHRQIHPYTGADPGGWAWTDLPGGVPDADDTAGALLALKRLGPVDERTRDAAALGVRWLMGLQNRDGGIPTFCRGWSKLPFDRSGADLTAHALRALSAWRDEVPAASGLDAAVRRGLAYLLAAQGRDGTWKPLWFGNESAPGNENLVYGTARVLIALRELRQGMAGGAEEKERRGTCWLLSSENTDGGWGGTPGVGSSVEETAVAVEALAANGSPEGADALARGTGWLVEHVESGTIVSPSPIGFYFANLWYFEKLYPLIFTVSALGRARQTHRNS